MKVAIDQSRCVGAGQCVLVAPEVFDQRDDDGIVLLLQENPPAELHAKAKEAAQLCPALAIEVDG
ncbi:ferredoxin [Amycolatopsis sp. VS8301801F10]|uniref:ferredoxin n=1 Tax=unclassified Amycolatopsis TaxID=2618356 RepID=UPI0038FC2C31